MQRLARYNFALGGPLIGMVALRLLLWPMARPAYGLCNRPPWSDFTTTIATVFVNDGTAVPEAFQTTSGTFDGDRAYFQVYALTDDPRLYANVTEWVLNHCGGVRTLRVRVKAAPGSHDVSGEVGYTNSSDRNVLWYRPKHLYRKDRYAVLTFDYHLTLPDRTLQTTFTLKIPGQPPLGAADRIK
jgi:hypothetical protein